MPINDNSLFLIYIKISGNSDLSVMHKKQNLLYLQAVVFGQKFVKLEESLK